MVRLTVGYIKSSAENMLLLFGLNTSRPEASGLNFTVYLPAGRSFLLEAVSRIVGIKIWRLSKNAQTLVLATNCAILYTL
ncbi:hypothetical protein [Algibacter sp. 2305UL17-15]|uniref:hypothetical protein n=1 Tax=Algibacter sp. 2305UL17-15 TaxID=3231268 RepID=UPI00345A2A4F